mmetsp:Transcript_8152/g.15786  ORF Transcript_8152/g.15786 Transcript_8152/m.15786 type:complete len:86 (+) Transcript_8152:1662-1919(+)
MNRKKLIRSSPSVFCAVTKSHQAPNKRTLRNAWTLCAMLVEPLLKLRLANLNFLSFLFFKKRKTPTKEIVTADIESKLMQCKQFK